MVVVPRIHQCCSTFARGNSPQSAGAIRLTYLLDVCSSAFGERSALVSSVLRETVRGYVESQFEIQAAPSPHDEQLAILLSAEYFGEDHKR